MSQLLLACAGPTTPFGPLENLTQESPLDHPSLTQAPELKSENVHFVPKLIVSPDRQVLHDQMDITVAIEDRDGISSSSKLELFFNGQLLKTRTKFLLPPDNSHQAFAKFTDISLRADRRNQIVFSYQNRSRAPKVNLQLEVPECEWNQAWSIGATHPFPVSASLLNEIESQAKKEGINPALVFGLIAQESGFDPKAISWAKALGLTQVTPIGDRQLKKTFPGWPRNKRIAELPVPVLKMMLASGKIKNDWRLDPKLSISGGIKLLKEMREYWGKKPVPILLSEGESPPSLEDLTLASYNSGALRVFEAIQEKGLSYLNHRDLREAKRYVSRVKSYCYHFAEMPASKVATR